MATSPVPVLVQTPKLGIAQITPATTTTAQTVYTGGTNGSKVVSLFCSSTDTAAQNVQVSITRSATTYILGTVAVPIASGTNGTTPSVDLMNSTSLPGLPVDADGQRYIFLIASDTLNVAPLQTITTAKAISCFAVGGDF